MKEIKNLSKIRLKKSKITPDKNIKNHFGKMKIYHSSRKINRSTSTFRIFGITINKSKNHIAEIGNQFLREKNTLEANMKTLFVIFIIFVRYYSKFLESCILPRFLDEALNFEINKVFPGRINKLGKYNLFSFAEKKKGFLKTF